jgi:hypothetical protein
MLITNFELRWLPTERTHVRLRISNLETVSLEYALSFFRLDRSRTTVHE